MRKIRSGRRACYPFAHGIRAFRNRSHAALARAAGPVLEAGARRSPHRRAAAVVAHLVGPVAGGRRCAACVDPVRVHGRRVADPFRGMRDQRLRRPLAGSAGGAHARASARDRGGLRTRSPGRVRRADAGGVRAGAHVEPPDRLAELRRPVPGGQLSVSEALHLSAAGLSGPGLRLGHPDGVRRRAGRGAAGGLGAVRRQYPVGHGVRHLVCDGGSRGRHPCRIQVHGHPVRRPRPGDPGPCCTR